MKIPKKVKIGGLTYKVTQKEDLKLGIGCIAEILFDDLQINIRPMAKEVQARSLLHEILHGIFYDLGYTEQEEKKIDELAGALYALIVDNPGMFGDTK